MEQQFNPAILKASTPIICSECDGMFFTQASVLRKIPKTLVGSPKDVVMQIPVNICTSCNSPLAADLDNLLALVESTQKEENVASPIITD